MYHFLGAAMGTIMKWPRFFYLFASLRLKVHFLLLFTSIKCYHFYSVMFALVTFFSSVAPGIRFLRPFTVQGDYIRIFKFHQLPSKEEMPVIIKLIGMSPRLHCQELEVLQSHTFKNQHVMKNRILGSQKWARLICLRANM